MIMRRIFLLLFALAVAGGGYWWITARQPADAQARGQGHMNDAIPVVLATAETRDVPIYLDGLGTVQASATVTVKPQVDGTLTEVRYHEGQDVHAGDVLAIIDPRTYQASLDQAVAKKRQDEANLANARTDLTRYQKLAATAYTSAQQADTQKALVAQLEAQVAQDQAQIDTAKAQLSYTTITSPIDGRAGIRLVDAGNLVHATDTTGLVVITTLKPISVLFTLPQQSLPAVSAAMQAGTPEVLALPQLATGLVAAGSQAPRTRTPIDRGTLTVLDNQVDQTTGTIKLKATFPNEKLQLWPGAFVTVRVRIDTQHNVIVVPPVAIQRGPQGAYVYVVNDDMAASRRPVQITHEDENAVIIAEGLAPGDRVVVDGAARLTDKAKVTIVQPSGTTPGAGPRTTGPETASRHPRSGPT
jgi:multidrug efflux system membrane fusion protein